MSRGGKRWHLVLLVIGAFLFTLAVLQLVP